MEALVFLCDMPFIHDAMKKYSDYHKVLVTNSLNDTLCDDPFKEKREYYDEIIPVGNVFDKNEVYVALYDVATNWKIKAIYGTYEHSVEIAGYLRDKFNVSGMGEKECLNVRDKALMKKLVSEAGIKTCAVQTVRSIQDISMFIKSYGFPIIIKPVRGFSSENTYKIINDEELKSFEEQTISGLDADLSKGGYIVESFIEGEEYHCDSIVVDGEIVFTSIGKYHYNCIDLVYSNAPLGSIIFPSQHSTGGIFDQIKLFYKKVIDTLEIKNSICHLEVFINSNNDIYFGEIAGRIGGPHVIGPCINNSHNINIFQAFVDVGVNNYNANIEEHNGVFTGWIILPFAKGEVIEIGREEDYKGYEGILEVAIYIKEGEIIDNKNGFPSGHIIMQGDSYEDLKEKLLSIYSNFRLACRNIGNNS